MMRPSTLPIAARSAPPPEAQAELIRAHSENEVVRPSFSGWMTKNCASKARPPLQHRHEKTHSHPYPTQTGQTTWSRPPRDTRHRLPPRHRLSIGWSCSKVMTARAISDAIHVPSSVQASRKEHKNTRRIIYLAPPPLRLILSQYRHQPPNSHALITTTKYIKSWTSIYHQH